MAIDRELLGGKLERYRLQLQLPPDEVSAATGISAADLLAFESGEILPSGDDLLILADFYKADYKFFISNERLTPFEQTEKLYRSHGSEFSKADRRVMQEFLFLADCEAFLETELEMEKRRFTFLKKGRYFKGHAEQAAAELRGLFGYSSREVPSDVFRDFRRIGIHVFRRRLENSRISGLFVRHPLAGNCILINYTEDAYRQRFTAAHEAGHAILDDGEDVVVSFWDKRDLSEIRANTFASRYLLPPELLHHIPDVNIWSQEKAEEFASRLMVNTQTLANALAEAKLIPASAESVIKSAHVRRLVKIDPELATDFSAKGAARKKALLERGLSDYYVQLCFDAYRRGLISAGRLQEMLLLEGDSELREVVEIYGGFLSYGD